MTRIIIIWCMLLSVSSLHAQKQPVDSLTLAHSPRKACIMSAILPGAGQVYNHKIWKVPVIYAGFAGFGYFIKFNNDRYKKYKKAYIYRSDDDPTTVDDYTLVFSDQDLATLKDYYRRNRDVSIIGAGVLYILNIVDASVDAHLFNFNVDDNLSMRLEPAYQNGPGIRLSLNF